MNGKNNLRNLFAAAAALGIIAIPSSASLVAQWGFNGDYGDSSANLNNGTVHGSPSWETDRKEGTLSLSFYSGYDYVEVSGSPSLDIRGTFTIELWFKANTYSDTMNLVTKDDSAYGIQLEPGGIIRFFTAGNQLDTDSGAFSAGTWVHAAAVYTGTQRLIYVNGSAVKTESFSADPLTSSSNLFIGRNANSPSQYFSGIMDDVKIYDSARTSVQIALDAGGPVAYWNFEDNSVDATGNGNDATLYGGAHYETNKAVGNYSLYLDGVDDFAGVSDSLSLGITGALTIEMWVNPITHNGNSRYLISKGDDAYGLELGANPDPSSYDVNFYCGGSVLDSRSPVTADQWSHIAAVYDGQGTAKIYINGSEVQSGIVSAPAANTNNLTMGQNDIGTNRYRGYIDDVKIYNRARSAAEIYQDYDAGSGNGGGTTPGIPPGAFKIGNNRISTNSGSVATIYTGVSASGNLDVSVYDVSGTRINHWSQNVSASNNSFTWDGRADDGSYPSRGIYYIKITGMGIDDVEPVVISK